MSVAPDTSPATPAATGPGATASPSLPASAAVLRGALIEAVRATQGSAQDLDEAAARLAAVEPEHVRGVGGDLVRTLLETASPDGLDVKSAQDVIAGTVTSGGVRHSIDVGVLVLLVTGSLGLHEGDEVPTGEDEDAPATGVAPAPVELSRHLALLIAELLPRSGSTLSAAVDAALAERARTETIELP